MIYRIVLTLQYLHLIFADGTNLTTSGATVNEIQDNLEIELNKF